jgi:glycosyltransferase involved in cell wall biosynthesis
LTAVLRVGYTCHDSLPSPATSTQQIIWTLVEVARLGVHVTLTVPAFRGQARGNPAVAAYYGVPAREVPDSFHVSAIGATSPRAPLAIGWFDWRLGPRFRHSHNDVMWTRDPVAAVSLLRADLPTIFETYRTDIATSHRFAPWRAFVLRHPRLVGVIAHSRLTARAFTAAGVADAQCLTAYNGFAPAVMTPAIDRGEARQRLGLPAADRLVVYTGHIGGAKGTDALVDLASRVPEGRFVLVGAERTPGDARRIETRAQALGTDNIVVRPHVPVADVALYLYAADCLIIPPTDEPLRRYGRTVLPMKTFSYLGAGRAIVAPRLPDIEEVLTHDDSACLVSPTDTDDAARMVRDLLADRAQMDRLGARACQVARGFTWAARAQRIVAFLNARCGAA